MKKDDNMIGRYSVIQLTNIFDNYKNKTGDKIGSIETETLQTLMKNELDKDMTYEQVAELMAVIDSDGNGTLEIDEFLEFMKKSQEMEKDEEISKEVFRIFDRDENGYITPESIFHVFLSLGENISLKDIEYVLKKKIKNDIDGDGNLNYQDFQLIMKKYEDKLTSQKSGS